MRMRSMFFVMILFVSLQAINSQAQSTGREADPKNIRLEPVEEPDEPLGPLPKLDPSMAGNPEYVADKWWKHLRYASKEKAAQFLRRDKLKWEQVHRERPQETSPYWIPPTPGDPDFVEDYFVMPPNESIVGCTYVKGYSYPDICYDREGNLIFNSETDRQEALDKIVIQQKGKLGKYNKMPKVKRKPEFNISETFLLDE